MHGPTPKQHWPPCPGVAHSHEVQAPPRRGRAKVFGTVRPLSCGTSRAGSSTGSHAAFCCICALPPPLRPPFSCSIISVAPLSSPVGSSLVVSCRVCSTWTSMLRLRPRSDWWHAACPPYPSWQAGVMQRPLAIVFPHDRPEQRHAAELMS